MIKENIKIIYNDSEFDFFLRLEDPVLYEDIWGCSVKIESNFKQINISFILYNITPSLSMLTAIKWVFDFLKNTQDKYAFTYIHPIDYQTIKIE